uniref:ADP/ATP translocase n=1 Tax=Ciona intestinalis TaxID=7719 RepID=H2XVV3_CIOIN
MKMFPNFLRDMAVGGSAAAVAKTTIAPIERVKLLLQLQATSTQISASNQYKGIMDCLIRLPKEQGIRSYWRGNLTNVYRYFFTQALNFAFRDLYKSYMTPPAKNGNNFWQVFGINMLCGGAAGVSSMCITYPLDFARTRLSADVGTGGSRQFNGLIHCMKSVAARDGIVGLYKGLSLSIPTVIVYRATYFGAFDTAKSMLTEPNQSPIVLTWIIAQTSTTLAGLICYPLDTIRRRMVMQSGRSVENRHYKNAADCCVKMYQQEGGMRSFYKGALSNVIRGMGSALVLVLYDELKQIT